MVLPQILSRSVDTGSLRRQPHFDHRRRGRGRREEGHWEEQQSNRPKSPCQDITDSKERGKLESINWSQLTFLMFSFFLRGLWHYLGISILFSLEAAPACDNHDTLVLLPKSPVEVALYFIRQMTRLDFNCGHDSCTHCLLCDLCVPGLHVGVNGTKAPDRSDRFYSKQTFKQTNKHVFCCHQHTQSPKAGLIESNLMSFAAMGGPSVTQTIFISTPK